MAVSKDDVRHIAGLARIGVPEDRLDALAKELSSILGQMEVLDRVSSAGVAAAADAVRPGMPLRSDEPPSVALQHPCESFAPAMKYGFFLVPRLATHEDAGEDS
jgi:aspartyl-tRNA(Asn)/glutamyl-tRNA(Gln) amidotransferase subunit C